MFKNKIFAVIVIRYLLINSSLSAMDNFFEKNSDVLARLHSYSLEKKLEVLDTATNVRQLFLASLADHPSSLTTSEETQLFLLKLLALSRSDHAYMNERRPLHPTIAELCKKLPVDCSKYFEKTLTHPINLKVNSKVVFDATGALVATIDVDNTVYVWELQEAKCVGEFPHKGSIFTVAFSPDSKTLVTAGRSSRIGIWSLESQQRMHTIKDVNNKILEYGFNYEARESYKRDKKKDGNWSYLAGVSNILFSPDGKRLAISIADESSVWTYPEGKCLECTTHNTSVNNIVFDSYGKLRVTEEKNVEMREVNGILKAVIIKDNPRHIIITKHINVEESIKKLSYLQQFVALKAFNKIISPEQSIEIKDIYETLPLWLKKYILTLKSPLKF